MGKFSVGDKVFAKVRGYPAWPARIEAVADATPNKVKYHVFFYGTLETAVCKSEDIYPYAENKENYGKPSKRKFFNEGIAQIEGRAPVPQLPNRNTSKIEEADSDAEGTLIIDENPVAKYGKPIKRKRDSDTAVDYGDDKGVSNVSVGSDTKSKRGSLHAQKRVKKDSTSSSGGLELKSNESPSVSKQEIISRSGRKIKPKRFADEETAQPHNSTLTVSAITENQESYPKCSNVANNTGRGTAKRDENYKQLMIKVKAQRRKRLDFWSKEVQMLKLADRVRSDFDLYKANPERGLVTLDEFHHIGIEPLMLKKHPEVVKDIERLVKYSGNPDEWKYSTTQKDALAILCEKIRKKAKLLIHEFAAMFNVPDGSSFHEVFLESVSELKSKTELWDENKLFTMSEDPTVKRNQNRKPEIKKRNQDSDKSHCSSDSDNDLQEEE